MDQAFSCQQIQLLKCSELQTYDTGDHYVVCRQNMFACVLLCVNNSLCTWTRVCEKSWYFILGGSLSTNGGRVDEG